MNKSDISTNTATEQSALSKLSYWLQFEKHTWILAAGIGWFSYELILKGLTVLALIFSPYMLWHLFRAKWYKSILTFSALVILPFLMYLLTETQNPGINLLLKVLPLITFYSYTWIISYMIENHLNKLKTIRRWKKEAFINKATKQQ